MCYTEEHTDEPVEEFNCFTSGFDGVFVVMTLICSLFGEYYLHQPRDFRNEQQYTELV